LKRSREKFETPPPLPATAGIRDWPRQDRPRERLMEKGPGALSDAELLALLIRSGTGPRNAVDIARTMLAGGRSLRQLASSSVGELQRFPGVGVAKAAGVAAAFELGRRTQAEPVRRNATVRTPDDVAARMIPRLGGLRVEVFIVLLLDTRNNVIAERELFRGTLNASLVHPREVFKAAIDALAAGIIAAHNHPSGDPEPSAEDLEITRQLADTGRIVGIPLHDHLIVAGDHCTSLAERGLLLGR
jgi:DNA repair protein RadC